MAALSRALYLTFRSVSVAAVQRGSGVSWSVSMVLARGVEGGFDLIKALGHKIYPAEKALFNSPTGVTAAMLWSSSRDRPFRELLATGRSKYVALTDELVAIATRASRVNFAASIKAMKPSK